MASGPADDADNHSGDNAHQPCRNQFPQRSAGSDVDALAVLRFYSGLAFPQAGDGAELPMDFRHHALCVFIHAKNQHGREHGRNSSSDQNSKEDRGGHNVKSGNRRFSGSGQRVVYLGHKGAQQGDDSQACRGDGKAFGDSFYRIAGAVQFIGSADGFFSQPPISARPRALSTIGP